MLNSNMYKRYRFPPAIIQYAVWLYFRFNLSHSRCAGPFIEDLLAQRGIIVTHESIRLWCNKFGSKYVLGCVKNTKDMAILFSLMRFSSRLMVSSVISGEQSARPGIRMVRWKLPGSSLPQQRRVTQKIWGIFAVPDTGLTLSRKSGWRGSRSMKGIPFLRR